MADTPLVSVIIPMYNLERFVGEAIESVLAQTFSAFELLVIDDGSTDGSGAVAQGYASDPRVRYLRQQNIGLSGARNRGIRESRGEFLAFLDADDRWKPEKLARQVAVLRDAPEIDVVYSWYDEIDEDGHLLKTDCHHTINQPTLFEALLYGNLISGSGSAVMARASCFAETGLFDEQLRAVEDLDMWRRLALRHRFFCITESLVCIRTRRQRMQANEDLLITSLEQAWRITLTWLPAEYGRHRRHVEYLLLLRKVKYHYYTGRYGQAMLALLHAAGTRPDQIGNLIARIVSRGTGKIRKLLSRRARQVNHRRH